MLSLTKGNDMTFTVTQKENPYIYWGISEQLVEECALVEQELTPQFTRLAKTREINQMRVLASLQEARISESGFGGTTGYGYDDQGRDRLEQAFAQAFGAEKALVRVSITTGTQAIAAALYGNLRPGDELLSLTGEPYDTLSEVIGLTGDDELPDSGSLQDFGVTYREIPLTDTGEPDYDAVATAVGEKTKMVFIQRSRGYSERPALLIQDIERLVDSVRRQSASVIIMVDNCYGEFTETREPCMVGVDLCAGSLIKNPGGGIAPGGGYIAGRSDLVERAAARLTAPGIGSHVGPSLGNNRLLTQGFFLAPHIVAESLKGLTLAAAMFEKEGLWTSPDAHEQRGDIIQTLRFPDAESLIAFCAGVQASAPVDSFVTPVPAPMPGYDSEVIMAAGAFVQGSSLELSADAPVRPPFQAYMQGGLVYEQVKLAVLRTVQSLRNQSASG